MMWWDHGGGDGDWLAMSLMMVVFWGLLAALVVLLVRSSRHWPAQPRVEQSPTTSGADELLAERFARGEIDENEFTRMRDLLHANIAGSTPTGR